MILEKKDQKRNRGTKSGSVKSAFSLVKWNTAVRCSKLKFRSKENKWEQQQLLCMLLFSISSLQSSKKKSQIIFPSSEQKHLLFAVIHHLQLRRALFLYQIFSFNATHTDCSPWSKLLILLDYLKVCEMDEWTSNGNVQHLQLNLLTDRQNPGSFIDSCALVTFCI